MARKNITLPAGGLIVTLVIALGWNIEEAAARDVKLVKLRDVKPETLTTLKVEEERELLNDKLTKEIENAKKLLGELKTLKKETKGDLKEELSSLVKSESLLNEMSDTVKKGTCNRNKATIFVEKESFFYRAWKENAYHSVVPEKEKEFMSAIKRIIKLLKKT
ncbi:hypothetical protein Rs2_19479 [Raphanus sativus]|uniref:Uncharacterized protein LOC108860910 n=1 Tax=Raphanus sativus TaxID=3726 RepID=A0A6J0NZS6_RAPSA|nr:uncharacterized protein LOC108860910 [Raphanus sativus]XP_056855872.1 uncharacterized protein LOC130505292 [Raphanus sativus]XP_056867243.1 uncharacterized protein LOC130512848 [Raphanus sativus]KAJ4868297.1 hypothetical protein Rs2_50153 [Raphanus sativus]KAJ4872201.1 hypothetical protein Rs2_46129 [Raphanus sativus]KAJ4892685.1 hypothetical protein Rs2_19479 [Raphanus sativus]